MKMYGSVLAQHGHGHSHSHTSSHTHAPLYRPLVSAHLSLLSPLAKTSCWHLPNSILKSTEKATTGEYLFGCISSLLYIRPACVKRREYQTLTHSADESFANTANPLRVMAILMWPLVCVCVCVAGARQYSYMYAVSVPCVHVTSKIWRGQERKKKNSRRTETCQ